MASKQNLVKRKFPYYGLFGHEGPVVVSAMRDITSEVFERLDITSPMYVDQMIPYMYRLLRGEALKKKAVLMECKYLAKELVGDQWNLGDVKSLSTERLCTWDK